MRVLRLDLGGEVGSVDLHPFVTVMQGFGPDTVEVVVRALQALADGRDPGVGGLVEHGGQLTELVGDGAARFAPTAWGRVAVEVGAQTSGAPTQLPSLLAQRDQSARQAAVDAARLEEVRTLVDPVAAAEVVRMDANSADRRRRAEGLDPLARLELQAAFDRWQATPSTIEVAAPWVSELGERWQDHLRRSTGGEARLASLERRIDTAGQRLAAARAALGEAEARAEPFLLDEEDENRLAELATRPVSRTRLRGTRGRSEEDQAEIDALLAKAGQPTYAAYIMYRLAPTPSPEQMVGIQAARTAVAHAQMELAAATAARDDDPELSSHRQRLEALREEAGRHLGPVLPDDLGAELARHVEAHPNPEREAARRHLVLLALGHGLDRPAGDDDDALAEHLRRWLSGAADGPDHRAVARSRDLVQRATRHREALERIGLLEQRAEHSAGLVHELDQRIDAARRHPGPSPTEIVKAVERHLGRIVPPGIEGAVPVVLSGWFGDLAPGAMTEVLDRLEDRVERAQLVLACDHPEAGSWAEEAGLRRALRRSGSAPAA